MVTAQVSSRRGIVVRYLIPDTSRQSPREGDYPPLEAVREVHLSIAIDFNKWPFEFITRGVISSITLAIDFS